MPATHIDVANSHFAGCIRLLTRGYPARSLIDLLTAFVGLYQARTGTETHVKELKKLFDDIVKIPDVQLQM